jgi:signal transduction histidine kinase
MMVCVCQAEDINIHFDGATAKVKQNVKDSVNVIVNGANVNIESLFKAHKLTISVTGKSDDGKITLKSAGKAKVRLDGLNLTSQEGAPLDLRNYEKTFTFNEPFTIVR